jgi:hypothetical protein
VLGTALANPARMNTMGRTVLMPALLLVLVASSPACSSSTATGPQGGANDASTEADGGARRTEEAGSSSPSDDARSAADVGGAPSETGGGPEATADSPPDAANFDAKNLSADAFSITSPANGANVSGTIHIEGLTGAEWVNVAAFNPSQGNAKVGSDAIPDNGQFSIPVDTTQLANGPIQLEVFAFSVPAGQSGGNMAQIALALTVNNQTTAAPTCSGTQYYVSTAGSDSNNGTSPTTPWVSIAKVNSPGLNFQGGDCINFRGGDVFSGNLTIDPGTNASGNSASNPIVVQSLNFAGGTSDNATISSSVGGGLTSANGGIGFAAVVINQMNGLIFQHLTVRNGAGSGAPTVQGIAVTGSGSNVTVTHNDVGGFAYAPADNANCCAADIRTEGGYDNITISYNTIHGLSGPTSQDGVGIMINGASGLTTVYGNTITNIGGSPSSGAQGWTGNGIAVQHAYTGPVNILNNSVSYSGGNTTGCGGPSNILVYDASGAGTVAYNEVSNAGPAGGSVPDGACDWDGIDFDGGVSGYTMEYNYTHGNWGAGLDTCMGCGYPTWGPNTIRFNVSVDDGRAPEGGSIGTWNKGASPAVLYFYNNTVIQNEPTGNGGTAGQHAGFLFGANSGPTSGTVIANNLFAIASGNTYAGCNAYAGQPDLQSITWRNNDYYTFGGASFQAGNNFGSTGCGTGSYTTLASWLSYLGDTTSTAADPGFATAVPAYPALSCSWTPPTGPQSCPSTFKLNGGSAMIGAGSNVSSIVGGSMGATNYYLDTVPSSAGSGYDIGAD